MQTTSAASRRSSSRRRQLTAQEREEARQQQEQRLQEASDALTAGLRKLQSSDDWKRALATLAALGPFALGRYSFGNVLRLLMQREGIQYVGTYREWEAAGRQVRKGEKALRILMPMVSRKRADDVQEEREEKGQGRRLRGFKAKAVFALEQTDGPALPQLMPPDLNAPEAFAQSVETLRRIALELPGQPVAAVDLRPRLPTDRAGAFGWFERATRRIVVITGEKSAACDFATLVHEVAHAILHGGDDHHSTRQREVEAESVAYYVCHAFGVDSGPMSFAYVSEWASGKDAAELVAQSGERIRQAARTILEGLWPEACPARRALEEEGEEMAAAEG